MLFVVIKTARYYLMKLKDLQHHHLQHHFLAHLRHRQLQERNQQ
jgi:hypothetical protein